MIRPAILCALLGLGGCVVAAGNPYPPVPATQVEAVPPPPPNQVVVWQPGGYRWNGVAYVWMPGHYVRRVAAGNRWVPGHWRNGPNGWVWITGHWA